MSRTYSIYCKDCKISLWVGQGWPSRKDGAKPHLYKTEKVVENLEKFLFEHLGHELGFDDDENLDENWDEIGGND